MVADMIKALDERGIVQSIASKNTYDVAWPKIEALGLADYFLYPAIHWGPKSRSLQLIADELNINVDTLALVEALGHPHVKMNLDLYHAQIGEGNLVELVRRCGDAIGEIQVADVPGRCEPGTGEIHYPFLFALLDRLGYSGWVGCEYKPQGLTEAGLGWRPD